MNRNVLRLKQNLQTLINKANKTSNCCAKHELFFQIDALAAYLYYLGCMSISDYASLLERIDGYFESVSIYDENEIVEELIKHNTTFLRNYMRLYEIYAKHHIEYVDTSVNYKKISKAVDDFFSVIGCKRLYDNLNNAGKIIRYESKSNSSLCINGGNGTSYILLHNYSRNDIRYHTELVHEIGHAYVNFVLRKNRKVNGNFSEIIPFLFERLFNQFLYDNNLLSDDEIKRCFLNHEANIKNWIVMGIRTSQVIESKKYTLDGFKVIPNANWSENNVFRIIAPDINLTPWLTLYNGRYYVVANMASCKLAMDYQFDKTRFISSLPELIKTISNLSLEDLLKMYCCISDSEKFFEYWSGTIW